MYHKVERIRLDIINDDISLSLRDVETIFPEDVLKEWRLQNIEIQGDVDPMTAQNCYRICSYLQYCGVPMTLVSDGGPTRYLFENLFFGTSSIIFPRFDSAIVAEPEELKDYPRWSTDLGSPRVFSFESLKKLTQSPVYQTTKMVLPYVPVCAAQRTQSVYIDNVGQVFPCFWLGAALNNKSPHTEVPLTYDWISCNALLQPILSILQNQFFTTYMTDMLQNFPTTICEFNCGR